MAEENASPISAAKPPVGNPMESASTLKLKPVIRKPIIGGLAPSTNSSETANLSSLDQLRSTTQKLKGLTQQIPQQAILHKTGIIAEQTLTEAQKQASKSRTARISLSDAIGVAPVKEEPVPMKTIRIKRPVDLPSKPPSVEATLVSPAPSATSAPSATPAPAEAPKASDSAPTPAPALAPTMTQRKTLKIARPGSSVRPGGKLPLKKPGAPVPIVPKAEGASEADNATETPVDDIPEIQDIPEIPMTAIKPNQVASAGGVADVAKPMQVVSLLVQVAACAAMAFLAWKLYEVTLMPAYCGGAVM